MTSRRFPTITLAALLALTACGAKETEESPEAGESAPTVTASAPDSAEMAEQAALAREAKVSEADAVANALKEVPGGVVQEKELEHEDGKLIYTIIIKVPGKAGVEEVNVDAITGKMVAKEHEADPKPTEKKGGD